MELRTVEPGEFESFARTTSFAFGEPYHAEALADFEAILPRERTLGWREDGSWVATGGDIAFRVGVPGGELPAAGVTAIAVAPTHRRRGLLSGLMDVLLARARERGDALAILWASEGAIYGRFGFGMAAPTVSGRVARAHGRLRPDVPEPPGRVVAVAADAGAGSRLAAIYERERARRPGAPSRDQAFWRHETFGHEPDEPAERRLVIYEGVGGDEGYALHRVTERWDEEAGVPDSTLHVLELVAVTPEAAVALWRFLLGLDLMARTVALRRPFDEPLPHLLADPARLERRVVPGLWVRLLDVPVALAGRRYACADRLVLAVEGEGAFALEGGPDGAQCAPTSARADLALSLETLGALYLGGVAPAPLAAAGRIEERTPGALARAHAMLGWPVAPWCPFPF